VLFLSDIFPTGYMAAENCAIEPGDTVAVWGCGPVGQFAIRSAWLLGAGPGGRDRLRARAPAHGRGRQGRDHRLQTRPGLRPPDGDDPRPRPDRCIDAVGCEAHGPGSFDAVIDKVKAAVRLTTDRAHALREAIMCCRKGGTVSVPGAYVGARRQAAASAPR
jgi:threonine dehydrogenase-like Zn-dependent dehydrogenase